MKDFPYYRTLVLKQDIEPFLNRIVKQYSDVFILSKRGHLSSMYSKGTSAQQLKDTINHFNDLRKEKIPRTDPINHPGYAEIFEYTKEGLKIHFFTNPKEKLGNKELVRRMKEYNDFSGDALEEIVEKRVLSVSDFGISRNDVRRYL